MMTEPVQFVCTKQTIILFQYCAGAPSSHEEGYILLSLVHSQVKPAEAKVSSIPQGDCEKWCYEFAI